jgi:ABC-type uncharacterized transport system substrate-binding protein
MRRREFISLLGGAAVMWPLAARAQQPKRYRIAVVHPSHPVADMSEITGLRHYLALFAELQRLGYVEGQNLIVERYSGEGRTERYAELVGDVVRLKPDVIFAASARLLQNFKSATATIPIVGLTADPVAYGLAANLAEPGGNITGISADAGLEVWGKRLELLRQAVPKLSTVGILNLRAARERPQTAAIREATERHGISLRGPPLEANAQDAVAEYRRVFAAMQLEGVEALLVPDAPENLTHRRLIVELAQIGRLPAIYPWREAVEVGGFMAYTYNIVDLFRHAASIIDRILKGAKPGKIPFYQPTKFELVINLKTAKARGLNIPPGMLAIADEVIE